MFPVQKLPKDQLRPAVVFLVAKNISWKSWLSKINSLVEQLQYPPSLFFNYSMYWQQVFLDYFMDRKAPCLPTWGVNLRTIIVLGRVVISLFSYVERFVKLNQSCSFPPLPLGTNGEGKSAPFGRNSPPRLLGNPSIHHWIKASPKKRVWMVGLGCDVICGEWLSAPPIPLRVGGRHLLQEGLKMWGGRGEGSRDWLNIGFPEFFISLRVLAAALIFSWHISVVEFGSVQKCACYASS